MKTYLKSIFTTAFALIAAFAASSALAAVPVAVWNGNLQDGSTQGDYTLSLNGNSETDGIVTITGDKGIRFYNNQRTNAQRVSVIVKYENLTVTNANQVLVTFGGSNNSTDVGGNADMIGLYARANNLNANAVWSGDTWNQDSDKTKGAFTAAGQMAITYDYGANRTKGFMDGVLVYDTTGLRGNQIYTHYVGVGGKYNSTNNIGPASNLKILAVAIFDAQLTDAEVAAFEWPKPIVKTTPKVYALNFDSGSGSMSGSADSGIPYFDLPADCWNNFSNASGTRTADGFDLSTPNKDVLDDGLRVTWASGGTYSWPDATMLALKGYLDDGAHNGVDGPTITVPNIPFESYDVIVLAATDDGSAFRPVTVNGTSYTSEFDGYGVPGTANWGATHYLAPTAGRNMMYIRSQSGNLTVQGGGKNNGARGGIAAVIIVEAEVRKASTSGDVDWTSITWTGPEDPECPYILTLAGDTKITINKEVEIGNLFVKGTGALTIVDDGKLHCSQLDVGDRAFAFECAEGAAVSLNMKGTGAFVKKGEGTLTLSSSFAPASIAVEEGVLKAPLNATDWAFSTAENEKTITVADGAQFDFNGSYNRPISYKIAGDGPGGTGAILKPNGNGNSNQTALGSKLELTGDATINTVGRWCMINNNHATNTLDLAGYTLTKIGAGDLVFSNTTVENGGTLVIKQGTVKCNAWLGEGGGGRFWAGFDDATIVVDGGTLNVNHGYIADGTPFVLGTLDFKTGSVTVGADVGFTVANEIALSESALTTPVVSGALTLGENAKIRFPAGYVGGAAYWLCSGALTGREGAVENAEFYIGDTPTVGTLVYANGTVVYDRGEVSLAPEGDVTTAWINEQLAGKDAGTIVNLTIKPNATFTIDEAFAFARLNITCEGNFYLATDDGATPADAEIAKFFYDGVTGIIIKKWLATMGVININLNSGNGKFPEGDTSNDGMLAGNTPKSSWINTTGATGTLTDITEWKTLTQESSAVSGMTFTWDANTTWYANATIPIRGGYLDDGKDNGVTLTLAGVPYEMYDVIVYFSTDQGGGLYQPMTVNGISYTGDKTTKTTVLGNATWGDNAVVTYVDEGVNALRVRDLAGDVTIHTAKRASSTRGCVAAIQIVEVEKKEVVNSYEAEGGADVRVSYLNQIVTDGYTGGFTLTLHGGALIFDEPFVCAALSVNSTGDLTITTGGAEIASEELAKVVLNDVTGVVTYGFAVSPLATTLNGVVYTVGVGTEDAPAPISYVANGTMTLKDGTFYIGTTFAATMSTVNFVDATIYGLGDGGLGVGNETFNLSGSTAVVSEKFILSQGGAGRTSVFTMGDTSSVKVTGSSIVDSNQSSIMFGHWNGPSTFTMNDDAVFDATNAQVLVGKTANNHTINLNGGTFIAKGIKVSGSASGVNTLNWIGGELKLGEYGITSYNANRITVNVTNEVTLTATDATLPLSQPIAGPGTIRKQGEGVLELTSSLADFTGKIVADPADVISLTNNVLPLVGGALAKIEGAVMINAIKGDFWFKICEGVEAVPANLTILDKDGQEISPLCIVDGDLYYGEASGTFTLADVDVDAINALTVGGVYAVEKPTLYVSEAYTNLPDGFGFKREGATLYFFKKSNSISLKLGTRTANKESAILKTDTNVGGFPVAGVVWNNGRLWNQNNTDYTDYMALIDGNGEMTETTIAYRAPNTYFNGAELNSGNQRLTSTYLDDGGDAGSTTYTVNYSSQGLEIPEGGIVLPAAPNARGWEMRLSDIPYEMYDLYVYIASDQAQDGFKGCPVVVSIDGENWTYYAGAKVGDDASVWTPDVYSKDGTVAEGKNYIRFRISKASMQADDISTIYLTHGTRDTNAKKRIGLAGIQIVEIDDDGVRNYAGTGDWVADGAWQTSKGETIAWANVQDGEVLTAIIDADQHNGIVVNENVAVTTVKILGNNPDKVFTLSGTGALTAQSIDASGFKGTLRLEGVMMDAPVGLGTGGIVRMPIEHWGDYEIVGGSVIMEIEGDNSGFAIPTGTKIDNPLLEVLDGATLSFVDWTFRGTVQVDEGGVYDMVGRNGSTGFHDVILNGGTLRNGTAPSGPTAPNYINKTFQVVNLKLIADSILEIPYVSGLVNQGWGATTLDLGTNTLTKTGDALFTFANTTITGSGTVKVDDGTVSFDGYKLPEGAVLDVEVAEGATAKFANASGKGIENNGTLNILNNGGTVDLQTSVTVGDFLGTGTTTIAENRALTVTGMADYQLVPTGTELEDGATIRLGTGRNVLKDELLWCSGAVTLDAVDGAKFKGAGEFIWCVGEITMTEAFKNALKESGREVNIVSDELGSLVEIKMIPRFLIMLK